MGGKGGKEKKDERKRKDEKIRIQYGKELKLLLRPISSTICVTNHLPAINVLIQNSLQIKSK